jgi:hypothetical protein
LLCATSRATWRRNYFPEETTHCNVLITRKIKKKNTATSRSRHTEKNTHGRENRHDKEMRKHTATLGHDTLSKIHTEEKIETAKRWENTRQRMTHEKLWDMWPWWPPFMQLLRRQCFVECPMMDTRQRFRPTSPCTSPTRSDFPLFSSRVVESIPPKYFPCAMRIHSAKT